MFTLTEDESSGSLVRIVNYHHRPYYYLTATDISTVNRNHYSITSGWGGIIITLDDRHPTTKQSYPVQVTITSNEVLLSRINDHERFPEPYVILRYFSIKRTATAITIKGQYNKLTIMYHRQQLWVYDDTMGEVWSCNGVHTMVENSCNNIRNIIYPHGANLNLTISDSEYRLLIATLKDGPLTQVI